MVRTDLSPPSREVDSLDRERLFARAFADAQYCVFVIHREYGRYYDPHSLDTSLFCLWRAWPYVRVGHRHIRFEELYPYTEPT